MQRKGQAAMEFLMTYGWAILAAIIAIGVLAYFGVFSPGRLVGPSAVLNPPMGVGEFNVGDAGSAGCGATNDCINMQIIQNVGQSVDITTATITLTSGATGACSDTTGLPTSWQSGTEQTFQFDCFGAAVFSAGDTIAADITITYTQTGGTLTQQSTGTLRGTVQ